MPAQIVWTLLIFIHTLGNIFSRSDKPTINFELVRFSLSFPTHNRVSSFTNNIRTVSYFSDFQSFIKFLLVLLSVVYFFLYCMYSFQASIWVWSATGQTKARYLTLFFQRSLWIKNTLVSLQSHGANDFCCCTLTQGACIFNMYLVSSEALSGLVNTS